MAVGWATLSYIRETEAYYSVIDGRIIEKSNVSNFAIVPMARFTYLNKPMVRLYSQVGLGVRLRHFDSERYISASRAKVSGSITYFGLSVGQKFFGSMELASGAQGIFVIGGGYRF